MIKYLDMVQNEIKDEIDRSNTNGNKQTDGRDILNEELILKTSDILYLFFLFYVKFLSFYKAKSR